VVRIHSPDHHHKRLTALTFAQNAVLSSFVGCYFTMLRSATVHATSGHGNGWRPTHASLMRRTGSRVYRSQSMIFRNPEVPA
jgi:hypothetical protein